METDREHHNTLGSVARGPIGSIRNFLLRLQHLAVTDKSNIDYAAADPTLLEQLGDSAEATLATANRSLWAIGHLMAYSASRAEKSEMPADVIEAVADTLVGLGDLMVVAEKIAVTSRRRTRGSLSEVPPHISNAGK